MLVGCELGRSGVHPIMAAAAPTDDLDDTEGKEIKRYNVLVNIIRACGVHPKLTEPLLRIVSMHQQRP